MKFSSQIIAQIESEVHLESVVQHVRGGLLYSLLEEVQILCVVPVDTCHGTNQSSQHNKQQKECQAKSEVLSGVVCGLVDGLIAWKLDTSDVQLCFFCC